MANKGFTALWKTVMQIAIAVMLIIGGINAISALNGFGGFFKVTGDPLVDAVSGLFSNGTLKEVVIWVMAIIEILTGALLVLDFFKIKQLDKLDDLFLLIIMIAWIVCFVVLGDIIPLFKGDLSFMSFLAQLAKDGIMVAAFGIVKAKI